MRLRPLARRALITARPLAVFMRTRKPCVFFRWVVDGWKVRFIAVPLNRFTGGEKPEIIADLRLAHHRAYCTVVSQFEPEVKPEHGK